MMENYHELVKRALEEGTNQHNRRTGKVCRTLVHHELEYDLAEGCPALTTRRIPVKNIIGELIGFWRGYDSAADFRAVGCGFWDQNANETAAWLANPNRQGRHDYMGRVYGKQWTEYRDSRVANGAAERDALVARGYREKMYDPAQGLYLMEGEINQLEEVVRRIMTDPSDRRMMITGWRPDEFDQMCLTPCHDSYMFVAFEEAKVLNLVCRIRSWDLFLGAPANILSCSIFLSVVARLTGYEAGKVVIQSTNPHVYGDHIEQAKELLTRSHLPQPKLMLSDRIRRLSSVDEIGGVFRRIEPGDIWLEGYQAHAKIDAPMSA